MDRYIFEAYNNYVIPHGCHIYQTSSGMAVDKLCAYPFYQHALPRCKCVLCCCGNFPHITIQSQESEKNKLKTCTTINFHV